MGINGFGCWDKLYTILQQSATKLSRSELTIETIAKNFVAQVRSTAGVNISTKSVN